MVLGPSLLARILVLNRWPLFTALALVSLVAWAINRLCTPHWTPSRQRLMAGQWLALRHSLVLSLLLWGLTRGLVALGAGPLLVIGAGFVSVVAQMMSGLRVARMFIFQWLFAHSQHEGVPALLVDLFSIVVSVLLFGVLLHQVFLIEFTSLLATSAVMSVVLGLALQDTLGQLFAGISLQLDRPFRLGDWVELRFDGERVHGQVLEVSWRATLLLAVGDELITVPNKAIAQGTVLNFSGRERPFVRGYLFRLSLDADVKLAKSLLLQAAKGTQGVAAEPAPVPLIIETTDSWITLKMIVFLNDFGSQYLVADRFHEAALGLLAAHGVALASPRMKLLADP